MAEAKCILRAPGVLDLVAAPTDGRIGTDTLPCLPMGLRERIAVHPCDRAAAWGYRIAVGNPVYEPVQMRASVVLNGDVPADVVANAITARFAALLCPWRQDPTLPMAIGCSRLRFADLEADLSAIEGVGLLTGLSLVQLYMAGGAHGLRDTARDPEPTAGHRGHHRQKERRHHDRRARPLGRKPGADAGMGRRHPRHSRATALWHWPDAGRTKPDPQPCGRCRHDTRRPRHPARSATARHHGPARRALKGNPMQATRKELKKAFGNGMLPSGEDFADLIDTMLPEAELDAYRQAFEAWKARPEISFGTGPDAWVIKADGKNRLGLSPGNRPLPEGADDLRLGGVVQMGARTGAVLDAAAFKAPEPAMDSSAMQAVKADGKWHKVIVPPGRAAAFELTAYAPAPPAKVEGTIRRFLRKLTGLFPLADGTCHAVATVAPGEHDVSLHVTQSPDPRKGWTRQWRTLAWVAGLTLLPEVLLRSPLGDMIRSILGKAETDAEKLITEGETALNGLLAKAFAALGMKDSSITVSSATVLQWVMMAALALLALWVLRLLVMAWRGGAQGLHVEWRKDKGGGLTWRASHGLYIKHAGAGSRKLRYAITRLWN